MMETSLSYSLRMYKQSHWEEMYGGLFAKNKEYNAMLQHYLCTYAI